MVRMKFGLVLLIAATAAQEQLGAAMSPAKVTGQKVIVPPALTDHHHPETA